MHINHGDIQDLELKLVSRHQEAKDILSFELVHPDGMPLPPFEAGAHVVVTISPGLSRAYSLCNDPAERQRYLISVLRSADSRGGSVAMHEQLKVGQLVRVSVPRNEFELIPDSKRSILVAGGIGITPLIAMAEQLTAKDADFELHYCTRDSSRTAFSQRIAESRYAANAHVYHDTASEEERIDLQKVLAQPTPGTHIYVCGPAGFIDHVMSTAADLGWDRGQLHREYFAAPELSASPASGDSSFELVLASSGQRILVRVGQTAAQALQEAGVSLPMSCEQGICGTCVTTVLSGDPDHRDHYLTEEDRKRNDCFIPCCSRASSAELTVDL